jgi:hypothetical protein
MHLYDYLLHEFETDIVKQWYYSEDDTEWLEYPTIQNLFTAAHNLLTIETMRSDAMCNHYFERAYTEYKEKYPEPDTLVMDQSRCRVFLRMMYIKS